MFVFVEDLWGQFQSLCFFDIIKHALPLLWHFLGKAISLEMFDLVQSGLWRGHSGNIDLFLSHCSIVLAASAGLLSHWKLNIIKPKLQEDISVYFPNSVYLNSLGSEFFYLMTCCFYSDMHCKLWNLYRQVCTFPNHIQSIEFPIWGFLSMWRNVLQMIKRNTRHFTVTAKTTLQICQHDIFLFHSFFSLLFLLPLSCWVHNHGEKKRRILMISVVNSASPR